jgi:hypothetical protein
MPRFFLDHPGVTSLQSKLPKLPGPNYPGQLDQPYQLLLPQPATNGEFAGRGLPPGPEDMDRILTDV